jgi:alpha-glucosidase
MQWCRKGILAAMLIAAHAASAAAIELKSPDGNVAVTFDIKDLGAVKGCPVYRVAYKGRTVLADSLLGLEFADGALNAGLRIVNQAVSRQDTTWKPVYGERDTIRDHYNQLVLDLQATATPPRILRLTFRAYDEGVAFCYTLPAQEGLKDFTVGEHELPFHGRLHHVGRVRRPGQLRRRRSAFEPGQGGRRTAADGPYRQ